LGAFGPKIPNPKKTEEGNTTTIPDRLWTRIARVTVLTGNGFDGSVVAGFNFDLKFQKNDDNLKNSSLLNQVERKKIKNCKS